MRCPRLKLWVMDKPTYTPTSRPAIQPLADVSLEDSLWQPPSASSGAPSAAAQHWGDTSSGAKRVVPAVVIGVAVVALVVGMNYKFKQDDHETTTLAQGQAAESVINEAPPAAGIQPAPSPDASTTTPAPAVEAAPPDPAPVVAPRAETSGPAPAARPVTPRQPAPTPAPAPSIAPEPAMRAPAPIPTPEPTPAPLPNNPAPTPFPSNQTPQPQPDTSPQPPLPVPDPTPVPQPEPSNVN